MNQDYRDMMSEEARDEEDLVTFIGTGAQIILIFVTLMILELLIALCVLPFIGIMTLMERFLLLVSWSL